MRLGHVNKCSSLKGLDPFLDPKDCLLLLAVGYKNCLTQLLTLHEHLTNLHKGRQTILALLRQLYYSINGRDVVRGVLSKGVT